VGDIDFEVISGVENSDKFQKNKVFGREKLSWGHGNTGHTSSYYDHILTPFWGPSKLQDFPAEFWKHFRLRHLCYDFTLHLCFFLSTFKDGIISCFMNPFLLEHDHILKKMSFYWRICQKREKHMNLCKMRCLVKFSYAFLRIVLFTHVLHKEVNLRLCKLNFLSYNIMIMIMLSWVYFKASIKPKIYTTCLLN